MTAALSLLESMSIRVRSSHSAPEGSPGYGLCLRQKKACITCVPLPDELWPGSSKPSDDLIIELETVPLIKI